MQPKQGSAKTHTLKILTDLLMIILYNEQKQRLPSVALKAYQILRDPNSTPKEKSVVASDLTHSRVKGKSKQQVILIYLIGGSRGFFITLFRLFHVI